MKKILFTLFMMVTPMVMFSQTRVATSVERNNAGIVTKAYFSAQDMNAVAPTSALEFFRTYLKTKPEDSFVARELKSHDKTTRHEVCEQYYKGVKVAGGGYVFHYRNGKMTRARGEYIPIKDLNTKPSISKEDAMLAFADYKGISKERVIDYYSDLMIMYMPAQSSRAKDASPILTYVIYIEANGKVSDEFGYIDAHNGKVILTTKGSASYSANGTLETLYSGNVNAVTSYYENYYHLADSTRGAVIHTWDLMGMQYPTFPHELSDDDNVWGKNEHSYFRKYVAHDVYWALQRIYDVLYNVYSRNSYDDNGGIMKAYINYNDGESVDNSHWKFYYSAIFVDRDTMDYRPFASLDMIAHEFGHGITQYNIEWNGSFYSSQSDEDKAEMDAMDEGLSDIWAVILKYKATNSTNGIWQIGANLAPGNNCIRNIQYPNNNSTQNMATSYGDSYYQSGSAHVRGCVLSRWFYLLAMGGSGYNSIGNYYNVGGIGLDAAAEFIVNAVYENNLYHTKNFSEVRDELVSLALESGDNNLIKNVIDAWCAVGIGNINITGPSYIASTGTYAVEGIYDSFDVQWSLSDTYYNNHCLQADYPSYNMCTITKHSSIMMGESTLYANVYNNGSILWTVQKQLCAGFQGTYSNGTVSGKNIPQPYPIYTQPGGYVSLSSPLLKFLNVSHTGQTPAGWTHDTSSGNLTVSFPNINGYTVVVQLSDGTNSYYIPLITTTNSNYWYGYLPYLINHSGNVIEITTAHIQENTGLLSWNELTESLKEQETIIKIWNTLTGEAVYQETMTGESKLINISSWPSGIYAINVSCGEQSISKKVTKR